MSRTRSAPCADVRIRSFRFDYPIDVKQDEVVAKIAELNDPAVHGILVQLPPPASFDMARILHTVFPPCTSYGVLNCDHLL